MGRSPSTILRMRVGVVLEQLLAPVPGGTGRYTILLAASLARCGAPGDTVASYVAWRRHVQAGAMPGVVGPRRLGLPRRALSLAWARDLGPAPRRIDVVHAPTALLPPTSRPWFPQRAALVATIHDAVPWTHPETLTGH